MNTPKVKSNAKFEPRFPRSVSGKNFRKPFDHPYVEELARRLDVLYKNGELSENERTDMLKSYSLLLYCSNVFLCTPYWRGPISTSIRPVSPKGGSNGGSLGSAMECSSGYVYRISETAAKLEQKYFGWIQNDDL